MDIGAPIRKGVMVPEDEPIRAPEPAARPVPERKPPRRIGPTPNGSSVAMMSSRAAAVKRMVGDDPEGKRQRHAEDFYRTGEIATRALLAVEAFSGTIWECACGAGDMSRVLETAPAVDHVFSSDLVDRGYGTVGIDFLRCPAIIGIDHIITNPPYRYVDEFVLRAIELAPPGKIAMIARLAWLEGQRRKQKIFDVRPPARIWVFPYRIRLGLVAFAWFVWDKDHVGSTTLGWLPRPII